MRLIDADRLKRQVAGRSYKAKMKFIELIDNSPTVEPVKHGRWIPFERTMEHVVCTCTVCGRRATMPTWYNYCPTCGAKMRPISASPENGQEVEV